jgi:hypothetical protein
MMIPTIRRWVYFKNPMRAFRSYSEETNIFHTVRTRILVLTRKRDSVPIYKITRKLGISKSAINTFQAKAISHKGNNL